MYFTTYFNIYYVSEMDFIPFVASFSACLILGMEIGILIGVISDVLLLLYYTARPKIIIDRITVSILNKKILLTSFDYVKSF